MIPTLRLETAQTRDLFTDPAFVTSWRALAAETPGASYFQTPDWVVTWWTQIAGKPDGVSAMVWDGDELSGFLPLVRTKERLTGRLPLHVSVTTNAGTGIGSDHAGWLAATDGAARLLAGWVSERDLLLRGVGHDVGESAGGRLIESHPCPRLDLANVSQSMSSKLAKTLRNAKRRLSDQGVEFTWKPPGQVDHEDLRALYDLHAIRRSELGDPSVFEEEQRRAFHDGLLGAGSPDPGGTAVMSATKGEQVVGILYGFVWRDTFAYYQVGWEPIFHRWSLGSMLVMEAIDACERAGLSTFDFLRGADAYKYRFGGTDLYEGTYAVGRSLGLGAITVVGRLRETRRPAEPQT